MFDYGKKISVYSENDNFNLFPYLLFTYFLEVMLGIEPQNQALSYDRQML